MKAVKTINSIQAQVIQMIANSAEIDPNTISNASVFNVDIILDSLSFAEILMECEENFDVEVSVEDASKFKTVGDLVTYLANKKGITH